jgi:solute carrier family 13 (sodium-dependent dicarboxylate transporter), member 2/3/5
LPLAAAVFCLVALLPWHPDASIRRAVAIAGCTLILWISEVAPLGVIAIGVPVAAVWTGILSWPKALAAWGDPTLFLFLGAFLLARALEKHGAFAAFERSGLGHRKFVVLAVLLVAGTLSTMQNNTAVAAMLLPAVLTISRAGATPAVVLLALSYGATFGGMATPVGTAPNFLGYAEMRKLDASINFLTWLRVGVPVWLGTTLLAWGVLELGRRIGWMRAVATSATSVPSVALTSEPAPPPDAILRRTAIVVFSLTAVTWLAIGAVLSLAPPGGPLEVFVKTYLPESLVPVAAALLLFLLPIGARGRTTLERSDLQTIDWDTLFLIAGGLTLGALLEASGAARALAQAVQSLNLAPLPLMLAFGAVTVLLSELTSNTATAALLIPIARSLDVPEIPPVTLVWLIALCASLGFALPISTPPNAIVYGTRRVPLRAMIGAGLLLDVLCLVWVVLCVRWLA